MQALVTSSVSVLIWQLAAGSGRTIGETGIGAGMPVENTVLSDCVAAEFIPWRALHCRGAVVITVTFAPVDGDVYVGLVACATPASQNAAVGAISRNRKKRVVRGIVMINLLLKRRAKPDYPQVFV